MSIIVNYGNVKGGYDEFHFVVLYMCYSEVQKYNLAPNKASSRELLMILFFLTSLKVVASKHSYLIIWLLE